MPKLAACILAAGKANRMGSPKQLLAWQEHTLLEETIAMARNLTDSVFVVLGAHAQRIEETIDFSSVQIIHNHQWANGMGTSLALGTEHIIEAMDPNAILVMLVDQPLLKLEHYKALVKTSNEQPNKIVSSTYEHGFGVPAVFPKQYFESLKKMGADFGARKFMKANNASVVGLETQGRLIDLDTPEDYRFALSLLG